MILNIAQPLKNQSKKHLWPLQFLHAARNINTRKSYMLSSFILSTLVVVHAARLSSISTVTRQDKIFQ